MSKFLKETILSFLRKSSHTINIRTYSRQYKSNLLDLNTSFKNNTLHLLSADIKQNERKQNKNLSVNNNINKLYYYKKEFEKNVEIKKMINNYIINGNELLMNEEEFNKAYQQIKEDITKNKNSVDSPIAIILGGQPGAGKSNIYKIARKRFDNNLVELDCDAFRVYHPYYQQIKLMFGKEDGVKTNPFIFKAVDMLVEELSNEKYNLIIESSLKRSKTAINNGKMLPPKGYEVELHVMATNKEISWQGTINRYYEEMRKNGKPRAVPKDFHDEVISNICNSLNEVKQSGLMTNILMFDRKQNCLYNMKKDRDVDPSILLDQIINGKKNYF